MKKFTLIFKKIKNIFNYQLLKIFLISLLTVIVTIGLLFAIAWHYRARVFSFVARNYIPQAEVSKGEPILIQKIEEAPTLPAPKEVVKVEDTVITAVKKARPAVVSIVISEQVPNSTQKQQLGSGSGFLISSDGMIVTNRHVVDQTGVDYTVLLNNGKEYTATVLAKDSILDVAIIKIPAKNVPYLGLADSDKLEVGQSVIAIGNALGEFKNTVSAGVISGLSRSLVASGSGGLQEFLYKVIQTDAAINPGNSGGPLLNLKGEVVGINVALAKGSSSIGFSLPINSVKSVIDQVRRTGKISRPYVGVRYVNVNQGLKDKLNLSVNYGILVQRGATSADVAIIPGSPADKAGIVENDIILSINGVLLNQDNDFMSLIRDKKIGENITLRVLSNGVERNVILKLEEVPNGL